jgi:hypothetical protein
MKPLKKIAALAVILICVFSFIKKENKKTEIASKLKTINVENVLNKEHFECRPSSDYVFQIETNIVKKIRGANNINAKIFIIEKASGKKQLLAQEYIQVKKFEDAIDIKDHSLEDHDLKITELVNGDKIIGENNEGQYSFKELVKYEVIYNKYIHSTNKLLRLKRTI